MVAASNERVPLGGGVSMPRRITVTDVAGPDAPHVEVEIEAGEDGALRCRAVHVVSTPQGRDVLGADLRRVSLEALIEAGAAAVGGEHVDAELVDEMLAVARSGDEEKLRALLEESRSRRRVIVSATREARRGARRKVTPDLLRRVVEVYRASPDAPTKAVAEAFGVAHRTGTLYVRHARDAGLLPEIGDKS
jgi:hypothetical protein